MGGERREKRKKMGKREDGTHEAMTGY